jgi:hypothetical protein
MDGQKKAEKLTRRKGMSAENIIFMSSSSSLERRQSNLTKVYYGKLNCCVSEAGIVKGN